MPMGRLYRGLERLHWNQRPDWTTTSAAWLSGEQTQLAPVASSPEQRAWRKQVATQAATRREQSPALAALLYPRSEYRSDASTMIAVLTRRKIRLPPQYSKPHNAKRQDHHTSAPSRRHQRRRVG